MILKTILIIYFFYLALKDYKYKEVNYIDVFITFIISVLFFKKAFSPFILIYIILSLIWFYIEVFYFKDKEELFFPMGIIDMFYLIIIFSFIKLNFNISFTYTLIFSISCIS